jgi:hypothetical protein
MVLKEFFQSKKEISTFTTITSMWNKDNILVNNWVEMEAVCLDYFDLYNSPPQSPENEVAIEQILDLLVDKLPQSAKNILARSLSKIELLHVAKDMAIGKSPGPDGYAIKYYTPMWHIIGIEFTEMVNQSMACGQLPRRMNKGLIVLLFKGGI